MNNITIKIDRLLDYLIVTDPISKQSADEIAEQVASAIKKATKDIEKDAEQNIELKTEFIKKLHELGVVMSFELTEEAKVCGYYLPFSHEHNQRALNRLLFDSNISIRSITKQDWDNAQ